MKIVSSAFDDRGTIPERYTCDGDGINPSLSFLDIPQNAQSLVLIVEDPDVPRELREDGMWNHWIVWNIPTSFNSLEEDSVPSGVVGRNTGGDFNYYPPCPPFGQHRYFFKLYALDAELSLDPDTSKEELILAMRGHVIDMAELMGLYSR